MGLSLITTDALAGGESSFMAAGFLDLTPCFRLEVIVAVEVVEAVEP